MHAHHPRAHRLDFLLKHLFSFLWLLRIVFTSIFWLCFVFHPLHFSSLTRCHCITFTFLFLCVCCFWTRSGLLEEAVDVLLLKPLIFYFSFACVLFDAASSGQERPHCCVCGPYDEEVWDAHKWIDLFYLGKAGWGPLIKKVTDIIKRNISALCDLFPGGRKTRLKV